MFRSSNTRRQLSLAFALAMPLPVLAQTPASATKGDPAGALVAKARAIHDRVITLDTHDDISVNNFTFSRNYTQDLGNQANLPKMKKGGLDAAFFIVYVGQPTQADAFEPAGYQRAYDEAISKFEAIHRLTQVLAPDQIELALTSADVRRINAKGKKIALIGIENGYPVDISHPSKESMMQALQITKAPIIASHSSVRALAEVSRNMDDEQMISSDFDGGGGVDGWNGADETFNVTLELVRRGYTAAQIDKMWSGNLLRVMDEVQNVAKTLQAADSK